MAAEDRLELQKIQFEQAAKIRELQMSGRVASGRMPGEMPTWAVPGNTYARFRLSTAGDLGVGGLAADGEVEDYPLTIDPPARAPGLRR